MELEFLVPFMIFCSGNFEHFECFVFSIPLMYSLHVCCVLQEDLWKAAFPVGTEVFNLAATLPLELFYLHD